MKTVAAHIPGYTYGTAEVATSPVSLRDLENLKTTVRFTSDDHRWLELAGEVLKAQTKQLVDHWRNNIIANIPNLARHSRTPDGKPIPEYSAGSGLRFQQWILDTCFRPYDQDWLNYQHEIALRHTSLKKNQTDGVRSTPYVPLRDIIAFIVIMNETIKPYLAAKGNTAQEVDKMHQAWCKSMQLQIALWARPYTEARQSPSEW
jgi:hypothetical protein